MPQVALVIGASRGIGRQIAISLAQANYVVVVSGKSTADPPANTSFPPDPNSPASTITTVCREIEAAGGLAKALPVDVRDPASVEKLVNDTMALYGKIDALVYNAGAIWWSSVEKTPLKRFQLMQRVNIEGFYAALQACYPHFAATRWNSRVIVVCPPIYSRFFRGKASYAAGKVGMSVLVKGVGMDWVREKKQQMAITGIWPAAAIQSGATRSVEDLQGLRKATVFGDAILAMLRADPNSVNGELFLDEDYLRDFHGVGDFSQYSIIPGAEPRRIMPKKLPDLTVEEQNDEGNRIDSTEQRKKKSTKL